MQVKEPDGFSITIYQMIAEQDLPSKLRELIQIVPHQDINRSDTADIAYWGNPTPLFLDRLRSSNNFHYLGRDVKTGGFLVLQTDHYPPTREGGALPQFDPKSWREVFNAPLPNLTTGPNGLLPSAQGSDLHLQILQRL